MKESEFHEITDKLWSKYMAAIKEIDIHTEKEDSANSEKEKERAKTYIKFWFAESERWIDARNSLVALWNDGEFDSLIED